MPRLASSAGKAVAISCWQHSNSLILGCEKAGAVADALKYELPAAWSQDFLTLLGAGTEARPDPGPGIRLPAAAKRTQLLRAWNGARRRPCQNSCGHSEESGTTRPRSLYSTISKAKTSRSDPPPPWPFCGSANQAPLIIAQGGSFKGGRYCPSHGRWARCSGSAHRTRRKGGAGDCLTALGLLGDPSSVPLLLSKLAEPETAAPRRWRSNASRARSFTRLFSFPTKWTKTNCLSPSASSSNRASPRIAAMEDLWIDGDTPFPKSGGVAKLVAGE